MPIVLRSLIALLLGSIALDLGPAALPPENATWFPVTLSGGPVHDVGVSPSTKGRQTVIAAGNIVFVSPEGVGWSRTDGVTGPVVNVVAGPDGVIYVGAASGTGWRTTTSGRTWTRVRVRQDDAVHFLAISPDYLVDQEAYAITLADWRLFRTNRSAGSTWSPVEILADPTARLEVGAVAFSPLYETDEIQFAGTSGGVYRSDDSGQTWTLIAPTGTGVPAFGPAGGPPASQGLILSPEYGDDPKRRSDPDDRTLFAYNEGGVYRSGDDGLTWTRLALAVTPVRDLAVSNGWPQDRVLMAAVGAPGLVGAVSRDGGQTWQTIAGDHDIAGTAVALARDFASSPGPDKPTRQVIYAPLALKHRPIGISDPPAPPYYGSRAAYLATDGAGVWRSNDAGLNWDNRSARLTNVQVSALLFLFGGSNAEVLAGTANAGLYRSRSGGRRWQALATDLPLGEGEVITSIVRSPAFVQDGTLVLGATSGVWISRNRGQTWTKTSGPAPAPTLAISPAFARDRTLLAAGQMSTDGGASWSPLPETHVWRAVAFSPGYETDHTIWIGLDAQGTTAFSALRKSTDSGQTWQDVVANTLRNQSIISLDLLQVEVDPLKIFAGTLQGLLISQDEGKTWTRPANGLSAPIRTIVHQAIREPYSGAVILAASEDGVLWSVTRGREWLRTTKGLEDARAAAISVDGSTFLVGVPINVMRYGTASAQIFLPFTANRYQGELR